MAQSLIFIIKLYHKLVSPFFPQSCRFQPTCGEYMYQAIERYGIFHGLGLGIWRVLRCNPWSHGGYDPVP